MIDLEQWADDAFSRLAVSATKVRGGRNSQAHIAWYALLAHSASVKWVKLSWVGDIIPAMLQQRHGLRPHQQGFPVQLG